VRACVVSSRFFLGFRQPFSAVRRVAGNSRYWFYALVPAGVFSLLGTLGVVGVARSAAPALADRFSSFTAIPWLNELLVWAAVAALLVATLFVALLVTTPISAPALERMVAMTEKELGAPPRAPLGFWSEIGCGVRAQAAPLLWTGPAWIVLLLIDAAAPVLSPVTTVLRAGLASIGIAWGLLDYPLTLRGVGIRRRLRLVALAPLPVLGFGSAFALLFWFPCCAVLFVGVGVVGATELLLALATSDARIAALLQGRDPDER